MISGPLEKVRDDFSRVADVIRRRSAEGWPVLQPDEEWLYITHPEMAKRGVCPTCKAYDGREFRGDEILLEFPRPIFVTSLIIRPCVHERDGIQYFYFEPCHCTLEWQSPLECLERRLHAEKLAVMT